jgi:murein DD-endopeptidase MepM/ murein hydrolase activator NlpD
VPGYGGLILIRHDGGWISAYGRIATADVAKGDSVSADQRIGKSAGEPLHFELRRARVPVNPVDYLPKR